MHRIEKDIHDQHQIALRAEEEYDSESSEDSTPIVPDGEPGWTFQHHLDQDAIAIQPRSGRPSDTDIINPHSMLHHIAWFWGPEELGTTRHAGPGYHIGGKDMS